MILKIIERHIQELKKDHTCLPKERLFWLVKRINRCAKVVGVRTCNMLLDKLDEDDIPPITELSKLSLSFHIREFHALSS